MAGYKPAAVLADWPQRAQTNQILIADPDNSSSRAPLMAPLEAADPYFVWATVNAGRRVVAVRPSSEPGAKAPAVTARQFVVDCKPSDFLLPNAYLQVMIQIATGLVGDEAEDARRRQAFEEHVKTSRDGLRVRGVFKLAVGDSPPRPLREGVRFVTGIVADWWLECFLRRIGNECVRWEMGQARSPIQVGKPSEPQKPVSSDQDVGSLKGWSPEDPLLTGDVMVIIDHGCPFAHPAFRNADAKKSRLRYVWFQGSQAVSHSLPEPLFHQSRIRMFPYGKELRGSEIDKLIAQHTEAGCYETLGYEQMREASSHGGHVMSIACGGPNPLARRAGEDWLTGQGSGPQSMAEENDKASSADIIFIELPRHSVGDTSGGAMNVHLIDALHYVLARTSETAHITVNCSFGSHGGPHDNSSLLEAALDDVLRRRPKGCFNLVVPIGNAFNSACHAYAAVTPEHPLQAAIDIPADKTTDTFIEVWWPRSVGEADQAEAVAFTDFSIELTSPTGQVLKPNPGNAVTTWYAPMSGESPSATVVQTAHATATRHRMLVVIAPTWQRPEDASEGLAPYGHWQIAIRRADQGKGKGNNLGHAVPVDIWIERDDPIFEPPTDRQARFVTQQQVEPAEDFESKSVSKASSNTSYGSGPNVTVAGGYVGPTRRDELFTQGGERPLLAAYSSAGAAQPHLAQGKPDGLAAVDDGAVLWGRNAAGNLGRIWVRRNGTSVAAPQLARHLLNTGSLSGLQHFEPSLAGARGDGLSAAGEALQNQRSGNSRALPW